MEIHISRDGQQSGPYTLEDAQQYLANGQLLATDLAWHEGAADWMPLDQLLAQAAQPAAPGTPAAAVAPMAGGGGKSKTTLIVRIVLGVILLFVAVGVGFEHWMRIKAQNAYKAVEGEFNAGKTESVDALLQKIGRDPSNTENKGVNEVYYFEWGGSLRVYRLKVEVAVRNRGQDVEVSGVSMQNRTRFSDWKE